MGFNPPAWASQPCRIATLQVKSPDGGSSSEVPIDHQPYYLLGRDASACDITLDHASTSRQHAAIVHHQDGRLFIIDLASAQGTLLDGAAVTANKPTLLKDGALLRFAADPRDYVVRCESSAEKRRSDTDEGGMERKRSAPRTSTVRASHLLVKHRGSRNPSSWKEPKVTRSQEEAMDMIKAFRERIVSGEVEFAALASKESHCSSAQRGGDLGKFGPGQMQRPFEDATYALEVNELSQAIITDSGVHLILRTG